MTEVAVILIVLLAVILGAGIWIGLALMATGGIALMIFRSMPVEALLGQIVWNTVTLSELVSLPLFVLMAEILFRTKLAASMFDGLAPWTSRLPGRLLHINVLACTLFAAVSGSSAATAATVGRITLEELEKRGYDRKLSIGSLAGAGTLGFLIPPSIVMIVYGVLSNTSILKLFIAGVLPGLMLAMLFIGWIMLRAKLDPSVAPLAEGRVGWRERFRSLPKLLPVLLLIGAIIGSMYAGWASPNEAAIIGVLGSLIIAATQRTLTRRHFFDALMGTTMITCMIGLILAGAAFLSSAVGFLGIANQVAAGINGLGLGKFGLVLLLLLIYGIL
ncbi:MAG: TRAP transporter large permease, partial [Alphaproteobacteria bacterium]